MDILGYTFKDAALLEEALTTPSCRMKEPTIRDNQRLEFLGDAVLGFLAAECVYARYPNDCEGPLSVRRTHMVSTASLCAAAEEHDLARLLHVNRISLPLPRGSKTIADAVEAILGAAFLDGGWPAVRAIFAALGLASKAGDAAWSANPKGELQVRAQAMHPRRHPQYELIATTGKAHAPRFTVRVTVKGVGSAEAVAGNHREAEAQAAAKLLALWRGGMA